MSKIIFLGTTCMQPTKDRNHSGIFFSHNKENVLFDCGEGIQRQMRVAGLKPSKLTRIMLSHWHGDHVLGLPGLLSTMGSDQYSKTLHIYGPKGTKKYFNYMKKAFPNKNNLSVKIHEVSSGIIYEDKEICFVAQKLKHSIPCLGYSFIEKERLKINVAKVKKLGLEGPILGKIQSRKNVVFNGKKINFKDVTLVVKSKKLSYVADTRPCTGAKKLAKNADLLICESTYHSKDLDIAKDHDHMTSKEAAELAKEENVKKLILTHPSLRYKKTDLLVKDAKKVFKKVVFAKDFMKVEF